jgi:hypothetical protein
MSKVVRRNRVFGAFVLPINADDPPPRAIMEQLDAVNASHEWLGIVGIVPRLVRAPDVSDSAKLLGSSRDFFFKKTVPGKIPLHAIDVAIDIEQLRREFAGRGGHARCVTCRNQARPGKKERALPLPVALLSGRPGNDIVSSRDDSVHRGDIGRIGHGYARLFCWTLLFHILFRLTGKRVFGDAFGESVKALVFLQDFRLTKLCCSHTLLSRKFEAAPRARGCSSRARDEPTPVRF